MHLLLSECERLLNSMGNGRLKYKLLRRSPVPSPTQIKSTLVPSLIQI